ncbi:MAG: DUF1294 domain-containing protein [Opitutae bacterium]|nr:DUF1294 domain-containing protein [Opitutae bacterium]
MYRLLWRGYLIISILTLMLFGLDKFLAKAKWKRIPERWFHTLALLGGFPGGFVGIWLFEHKSQNQKFRYVLIASLILHAILLVVIIARLKWF